MALDRLWALTRIAWKQNSLEPKMATHPEPFSYTFARPRALARFPGTDHRTGLRPLRCTVERPTLLGEHVGNPGKGRPCSANTSGNLARGLPPGGRPTLLGQHHRHGTVPLPDAQAPARSSRQPFSSCPRQLESFRLRRYTSRGPPVPAGSAPSGLLPPHPNLRTTRTPPDGR